MQVSSIVSQEVQRAAILYVHGGQINIASLLVAMAIVTLVDHFDIAIE